MDSVFTCAFCLQENAVFIDPTGGSVQQYVEDCQVCCRPNRLSIDWDEYAETYMIESQPES